MRRFRYFSEPDFAGCQPPCTMGDMDRHFLEQLDQARHFAGIPFVLNSAFRTVEHEKEMGRDGTSSHVKGIAVDIRCHTGRNRFLIVQALMEAGFTRIGIANTFIHADLDTEKSGQVIWNYQ